MLQKNMLIFFIRYLHPFPLILQTRIERYNFMNIIYKLTKKQLPMYKKEDRFMRDLEEILYFCCVQNFKVFKGKDYLLTS